MADVVHINHRKRIKDRFLAVGLDSFADHEALELLLFYSIPRKDVNVIAHRLIDRFGSVNDVLEADVEELVTVEGVGKNTATLIRLVSDISRKARLSSVDVKERFDTIAKIGNYLVKLFSGVNTECVYALLFNGKSELIKCVHIFDGSISSVGFSTRTLIENAIKYKASGIVLAHNHPHGLAIPSGNDIELTSQIEYLCAQMNVRLLEHVVVADEKFAPIMHKTNY